MKKLAALLVLAAAASAAISQPASVREYTCPKLPPQEVLDRLSLTLAWSVKLPTEGSQDGLFSVQLMPGDRQELLVQTRFGLVILMDGATGDVLWSTAVGLRNQLMFPAGWNDESIFLTRHEYLHVLNRQTGKERLHIVVPITGAVRYGFVIGSVPSAAPAADQDRVYLCLGQQVRAYIMPRFGILEKGARPPLPRPKPPVDAGDEDKKPVPPETVKTSSAQPLRDWNILTDGAAFLQPPILVEDVVNVLRSDGTLLVLDSDTGKEVNSYKLHGTVAAPMGHHGRFLYMGSEDHRVYAFDLGRGQLQWRFFAGAPVLQQPWVTDRDVFVAANGRGLYRVDRLSGEEKWLNKRAVRFLAQNKFFVYALDRTGKFLVLDHIRGSTLSEYDLSDYTVALSNEQNDRIFLGAHDGTLICLHHREQRSPFLARDLARPGPKEGKKDKGDEKKEDFKKDKGGDKEEPKEKKDEEKKEEPKKDGKKNGKDELKKKEDAKAKDAEKAGRLERKPLFPLNREALRFTAWDEPGPVRSFPSVVACWTKRDSPTSALKYRWKLPCPAG
jgi:outer membrane protein assembly factor BamB